MVNLSEPGVEETLYDWLRCAGPLFGGVVCLQYGKQGENDPREMKKTGLKDAFPADIDWYARCANIFHYLFQSYLKY